MAPESHHRAGTYWHAAGPVTGVGARRAAHGALLAVAAVATLTVVFHVDGPVRILSVFVAVCLLPGAAILTAAPVDDPLAWLGLSIVISFAAGAVVCCGMVAAGWWHPSVLGIMSLAGCGVLVNDLVRGPGRAGGNRHTAGAAVTNTPS
jgi:hypothetical protein